ncbi:MAG: hypothetical protein COW01_10165 [Bdellovibrionales bacterium CG12_big_fil_rev_8_21_14_0_65_38_15]|nr:MAG: hypothetical protein COW79_07010 [Bdellovibrionales bacterium CG22_combo_CG10-13_8_21_14_all_38_13]PIQ54501.1 MAG: hypothetical protein COW01_10165 [Bdellovibrionales bacterium CG12_big_fil_rev_8_21_14_0_65_38_15]PIR29882.1 MAG: hypothetical protein COV38_08010 [Bdellovibrionales bacterium CG11_big_fil_rev_8_21_14_0_20_38_13]
MLEIRNMSYQIPKGRMILSDLNLTIWPGEFLGLLGKNGAGKTTFLDLVMGLRSTTHGEIQFMGHNPQFLPTDISQDLVFLSQDIKLPRSMSIQEYLNYMSFFYKRYDKQKELELIDYFEISPTAKIGSLSTGQQKKAQIVSGLCANAKLIIIDEITAVLDPESRLKFFTVLEKLHAKRTQSLILATNIAEDLIGRVDRVLFLADGKATYHPSSDVHKIFKLGEVA